MAERARTVGPTLTLTGGFGLTVAGESVALGHASARVLAYVALAGRAVPRSRVAAELWPDSSPTRAATCLRTALWRVPVFSEDVVVRCGPDLALDPGVLVDVTQLLATAASAGDPPVDVLAVQRLDRLTDLLPGWNEGWVLLERDRLQLRCLAALEAAAAASAREGLPARSLELAAAALRREPLRESAWRLVVEAHRDQGNVAAVVRSYEQYRTLLRSELDIGPSALMERLIDECGVRPG